MTFYTEWNCIGTPYLTIDGSGLSCYEYASGYYLSIDCHYDGIVDPSYDSCTSDNPPLSNAAIAGCVIGSLAGIGILFYYYCYYLGYLPDQEVSQKRTKSQGGIEIGNDKRDVKGNKTILQEKKDSQSSFQNLFPWVADSSPWTILGGIIVVSGFIILLVFLSVQIITEWVSPMNTLLTDANFYYTVDISYGVYSDDGIGSDHLVWNYCEDKCLNTTKYGSCMIQQWNNQICYDSNPDGSTVFTANDATDIICIGRSGSTDTCYNVNTTFIKDFQSYLTSVVLSLTTSLVLFVCGTLIVFTWIMTRNKKKAAENGAKEKLKKKDSKNRNKKKPIDKEAMTVENPVVLNSITTAANDTKPVITENNTEVITAAPSGITNNNEINDPERKISPEEDKPDNSFERVITARKKKLFGFWSVTSETYGIVTLLSRVFSMVSLFISVITGGSLTNLYLMEFLFMHIIVSYFAVPIWQNYSIQKKSNNELIHCEEKGCICCSSCSICFRLLFCQLQFVSRVFTDKECSFIPFSAYNLLFMWRNPGKELNPDLPLDTEHIGFGRVYFTLLSVITQATLNLYLFTNAFCSFIVAGVDGFGISALFALFSLLPSIYHLKVYAIATLYGFALLPYTLALTGFFCCPDSSGTRAATLQVKKGTWVYSVITEFWKKAKSFY